MTGFILGEKRESSRVFDDRGARIPVTFIKTAGCYLVGVKWQDKHGYLAARIGFGTSKSIKKPQSGETEKAGIKTPLRFLREFRLQEGQLADVDNKKIVVLGEIRLAPGDELKPMSLFKKGDRVAVSGTSKGKGFQGVVKRHGFAGGPRTHGQSDRERAPGSIGQSTTPGRVYKGKRMAGRMGGSRVTVQGLEVVEAREDGIVVKGLVPGAARGLLEIRSQ